MYTVIMHMNLAMFLLSLDKRSFLNGTKYIVDNWASCRVLEDL